MCSLLHSTLCVLPVQVKTTRWLATGDSGQPEVLGALAGLMLTDGILGRDNKFSDIFSASRVPASLKTGQASSCPPAVWKQLPSIVGSAFDSLLGSCCTHIPPVARQAAALPGAEQAQHECPACVASAGEVRTAAVCTHAKVTPAAPAFIVRAHTGCVHSALAGTVRVPPA